MELLSSDLRDPEWSLGGLGPSISVGLKLQEPQVGRSEACYRSDPVTLSPQSCHKSKPVIPSPQSLDSECQNKDHYGVVRCTQVVEEGELRFILGLFT